MARRERVTFGFRLSCMVWNIGYGISAPLEGLKRGIMFGLYLSPKLGTLVNLLTSYIVPAAFACTLGAVGLFCGFVAVLGCVAEALRQPFAPEPYSKPISRMLVDWMPAGV